MNKGDGNSIRPITRDEMTAEAFDSMMAKGLEQAKANESRPYEDVIAEIRNEIKMV